MDGMASVRNTLVELREQAQLSQSELAKRLPYTASRVSRLESGDLQVTIEEAREIARQIGETYPRAKQFAEYLEWEWKVVEKPGFNHVSLATLRKAEEALQQLDPLLNDPDIKNAFAQQVKSCMQAILVSARYLSATEHAIAFIGKPAVGKTTAICALSDLRRPGATELGKQMVLQTGSGRITICEVHVRRGEGCSILVEPCSYDDVRQYVADFCDDLIALASGDPKSRAADARGISAEVEGALRNMAKLERRSTTVDGKPVREDPALDLARKCSKEDLLVEIMTRLDLSRRTRTSVSYPRDATISELDWLASVFRDINTGKHPDFSLPQRIEVVVPRPILGAEDIEIRLIDTRGNDEPSAPRRDFQTYLDDPRTVVVLCSSFTDAPDAATQAFIERAAQGGLQSPLSNKGALLVLPKDGEEKSVQDRSLGEPVSSEDQGREIRQDELTMTLHHLGAGDLRVHFLNVQREGDYAAAKGSLVEMVKSLRRRHEEQIDSLVATVERIRKNKADAQTRAVFEAATASLRVWFMNNTELDDEAKHEVEATLLEEMETIRYASTLRASVNRRGNWHNFDYWHGLGWGTRTNTKARTAEQVTILRGQTQTAIQNPDWIEAHGFLSHFLTQVESAVEEFYQEVQALGESAFSEQLRGDNDYWSKCQSRWGGGKGYKDEITRWTDTWFSDPSRRDRYAFIDAEVKRRWRKTLVSLGEQLQSPGASEAEAA